MFVATFTSRPERPALTGPVHTLAGRTEVPEGRHERTGIVFDSQAMTSLFGDYVTACGLTLPWGAVVASTEPLWVSPTTNVRCGDCFPAS